MFNPDDLPSMVRACLEASQGIVGEVADELVQRGVDNLTERQQFADAAHDQHEAVVRQLAVVPLVPVYAMVRALRSTAGASPEH